MPVHKKDHGGVEGRFWPLCDGQAHRNEFGVPTDVGLRQSTPVHTRLQHGSRRARSYSLQGGTGHRSPARAERSPLERRISERRGQDHRRAGRFAGTDGRAPWPGRWRSTSRRHRRRGRQESEEGRQKEKEKRKEETSKFRVLRTKKKEERSESREPIKRTRQDKRKEEEEGGCEEPFIEQHKRRESLRRGGSEDHVRKKRARPSSQGEKSCEAKGSTICPKEGKRPFREREQEQRQRSAPQGGVHLRRTAQDQGSRGQFPWCIVGSCDRGHAGADVAGSRPRVSATGGVPTLLRYYRQMLSRKVSGPMSRELHTLCTVGDQILRGQLPAALDTLIQRVKSLEAQIRRLAVGLSPPPGTVAQRHGDALYTARTQDRRNGAEGRGPGPSDRKLVDERRRQRHPQGRERKRKREKGEGEAKEGSVMAMDAGREGPERSVPEEMEGADSMTGLRGPEWKTFERGRTPCIETDGTITADGAIFKRPTPAGMGFSEPHDFTTNAGSEMPFPPPPPLTLTDVEKKDLCGQRIWEMGEALLGALREVSSFCSQPTEGEGGFELNARRRDTFPLPTSRDLLTQLISPELRWCTDWLIAVCSALNSLWGCQNKTCQETREREQDPPISELQARVIRGLIEVLSKKEHWFQLSKQQPKLKGLRKQEKTCRKRSFGAARKVPFSDIIAGMRQWLSVERACGHTIAKADLAAEYLARLQLSAEKLKEEAEHSKALTPLQKGELLHEASERLQGKSKLLEQPGYKKSQVRRLIGWLGARYVSAELVTNISETESKTRCLLTWQEFDKTLWLAMCHS